MNRIFTILCLLSLFIFSCQKDTSSDCFKSTGNIETVTRNLHDFRHIAVYDVFDIFLSQDTAYNITTICGENLTPYLRFDIQDDTLILVDKNKCSWLRNYDKGTIKVYISFSKLESITLYNGSDITSIDTIKQTEFTFIANPEIANVKLLLDCDISHLVLGGSTGDYTMKGRTSTSFIYNTGTGYVYADDLETQATYIFARSTGDCYVWANSTLSAETIGSGNIYYAGNPNNITISETHTGRVIALED